MKKYLHLLFVFLFVGSINNVTAQDSLNQKFAFEVGIMEGVSIFSHAKNRIREPWVPKTDLSLVNFTPGFSSGISAGIQLKIFRNFYWNPKVYYLYYKSKMNYQEGKFSLNSELTSHSIGVAPIGLLYGIKVKKKKLRISFGGSIGLVKSFAGTKLEKIEENGMRTVHLEPLHKIQNVDWIFPCYFGIEKKFNKFSVCPEIIYYNHYPYDSLFYLLYQGNSRVVSIPVKTNHFLLGVKIIL